MTFVDDCKEFAFMIGNYCGILRRVMWSDLCIKWITLTAQLRTDGRRQVQKQGQLGSSCNNPFER